MLCLEFEEELGSDEESGKDWSELEEEATKGSSPSFVDKATLSTYVLLLGLHSDVFCF